MWEIFSMLRSTKREINELYSGQNIRIQLLQSNIKCCRCDVDYMYAKAIFFHQLSLPDKLFRFYQNKVNCGRKNLSVLPDYF